MKRHEYLIRDKLYDCKIEIDSRLDPANGRILILMRIDVEN